MVSEELLGHLPDVRAVEQQGALCGVMEPKDQRGYGGLAAACAADDGGGFPSPAGEVQVPQGVFLCVSKAEGDILERENVFLVAFFFRVVQHQVGDFWGVVQHQADTLTALQSTGQGQDDHLRHHQIEQNQQSVLDDSGDVTDLEQAGVDLPAAHPVDQNHEEVDKEEGQAVQVGKAPIGPDRGLCVVGEGGVHTGFLPLFIVKRTNHSHAGEVFQENGAHPVQQFLKPAEQRGGAADHEEGENQHHQHHCQQDKADGSIQIEGEHQGQHADHRHRQDHLNGTEQSHLDRCDVRDGPGGDRGGAELPEVIDRQLKGFGVDGLPHIFGHLCSQGGAGISPGNGTEACHRGNHRHLNARGYDGLERCARGACVEHFRHQRRNEQGAGHVHKQQHNSEQAELPMGFEES